MRGAAVRTPELLELARRGGLPDRLYLLGPPGIGKTEVVMEACRVEGERLGRRVVNLEEPGVEPLELLRVVRREPGGYHICARLVAPHLLPEDTGYPRVDEETGAVVYHPPAVLAVLGVPGVSGILFIDELSNVARDDQKSLFYALINEKRLGWSLRLSPLVKIVAAGNPSRVSVLAEPLPAPLLNRVIVVRVEPPSVEEWVGYMDERYPGAWSRLVAAYLDRHPGDLYREPPAGSLEDENFPTPRSWTRLAVELYRLYGGGEAKALADGDRVAAALVYGAVGREAGARLVAFARSAARIPPPSELARNPGLLAKMSTDMLVYVAYEAVEALRAGRLSAEEYAALLAGMVEAGRGEEAALAARLAARKELLNDVLAALVKMGRGAVASRLRGLVRVLRREAEALGLGGGG